MADTLRVLDLGQVPALGSQALWHAVAKGVSASGTPTLSFARPAAPYVSVGYHHRLEDVDTEQCARRGWPIYRRMVGGGAVYLDEGQLLFQLSVPDGVLPASRPRALRCFLDATAIGFRAAGVPASVDAEGEIVVGDRKVCGHGAGQIGSAVVAVGNLIQRFDHGAAASVTRCPDADTADDLAALVRRYVGSSGDADAGAFVTAVTDAFADMLGLLPRRGTLSAQEQVWARGFATRFCQPAWTAGPKRPAPAVWRAKVRSGVWLVRCEEGGSTVCLTAVGGRVQRMRVSGAASVTTGDFERALVGRTLSDARATVRGWGVCAAAATSAFDAAAALAG